MKKRIKRYALLGGFGWMVFGILFLMPGAVKTVSANTENVFQVLFPANTEHVFDFIMDPQELIAQTNAAAYGGLTFEEGATLFFRRHDGGTEKDYSSSSDALAITNMGTEDVDIVLSASISPDSLEKIALTGDDTFAGDTEASLYLALTDGAVTVPILEGEDAVIQMTLSGLKEAGGQEEYRFWLVGAVNKNGDWSQVRGAVPQVTVTWSVAAREETAENEFEEEEVAEQEKDKPEAAESEIVEEKPSENKRPEEEDKNGTDGEQTNETKPSGTDPVEVKPSGTDPAEVKPSGTDPVETEPEETKPAGTKPAGTDPVETDPAEVDPSGTDPAKTEPTETETKPGEAEPAKTGFAGTEPIEAELMETKPTETGPAKTKSSENKSAESKAVQEYAGELP